jgi:PhnB protein
MTDAWRGVTPYIFCSDGIAAMEWMEHALGFRERMRTVDENGGLRHGEMQRGDALVMLGSPPDYRNPKELGAVTVGLYLHVDDVDAVYRQAVDAGADVDGPPQDQPYGERIFGVKDPEGQQWWVAKTLSG